VANSNGQSRLPADSASPRHLARSVFEPVVRRLGRAELAELGEQFGLQPFVLWSKPDGGLQVALKSGTGPGMGDGRDRAAVPGQPG
jgi:hypothetical protein